LFVFVHVVNLVLISSYCCCSGGPDAADVKTLIAAAGDRTINALEKMISPIVQKVKSKVGSELGKTEVECFNKSYLPAADLTKYILPTLSIPEEYQYVYRMVLEYTQGMVDIAKQKNVDEETHIHPPTFKLLQDLVKHFLPAHEMEFFEKSLTGTVEIGYETSLRTRKGVLPVTGETDQLICFGGVPVGNVEVKNISMLCNTPREIGEILAEDKGFAERHKQRVGLEPRLFPSVLVSGQRWVFVDRSFGMGSEQYLLFPALVTFDLQAVPVGEGESAVYESSVEMVSRMLMRMIHAMEKLIETIGATRKRMYDVYAAREDTEGEGDGGDEPSDDDEDPPDAPGNGKGPSATDKPTATAAASKGAQGGGGGGGGKRRVHKSDLTMVNMYRHDLDTLWHRTVLM
jgi:hypothetical protein